MGGVVVRVRKHTEQVNIDYELDEEYTVAEVEIEINEAIENRHNIQLIGRDGNVVGGRDGLDPMLMATMSVLEPSIMKKKPGEEGQ